jgi:hypothetical protein
MNFEPNTSSSSIIFPLFCIINKKWGRGSKVQKKKNQIKRVKMFDFK